MYKLKKKQIHYWKNVFTYVFKDVEYKFSYDSQTGEIFVSNFGVATCIKLEIPNISETIKWFYVDENDDVSIIEFTADEYIDLYINGAIHHYNSTIEESIRRIEIVKNATTEDEVNNA